MPRGLLVAILAILALSAGLGVVADRWARSRLARDARGESAEHAGSIAGVEATYWAQIEQGPITVPLLVAFLEAHAAAVAAAAPIDDDAPPGLAGKDGSLHVAAAPAIDEARIDALLARTDLAPDVALLGRFWRGVTMGETRADLLRDVRAAGDHEPPMPWANHLLAKYAVRHAQLDEAAERFLREATHFEDRAYDADFGIELWLDVDDWDRIDAALADPKVAAIVNPAMQLRAAIRAHDWLRALRVFPRTVRPPATKGTLFLAAVAALAWGVFIARLGHVRAHTRFRVAAYVVAFVLGVASVWLTLAITSVEEGLLHMTEIGGDDPTRMTRNALYFAFGVGLREEVSKLVFFLPLVPALRRWGTRLDVLVCGAIVGLGFAAEENLVYLHGGDLSTAMARFLTANFLHVSMTSLLAGALVKMFDDEEGGSFEFSRTLLFVAILHGAYDFFLSLPAFDDLSMLSMAVFFFLARQFLHAVSSARAKERAADARLIETFTIALAVMVGASFVYASALVGPAAAARALAAGLLGLGIILVLFVQELRRV